MERHFGPFGQLTSQEKVEENGFSDNLHIRRREGKKGAGVTNGIAPTFV